MWKPIMAAFGGRDFLFTMVKVPFSFQFASSCRFESYFLGDGQYSSMWVSSLMRGCCAWLDTEMSWVKSSWRRSGSPIPHTWLEHDVLSVPLCNKVIEWLLICVRVVEPIQPWPLRQIYASEPIVTFGRTRFLGRNTARTRFWARLSFW